MSESECLRRALVQARRHAVSPLVCCCLAQLAWAQEWPPEGRLDTLSDFGGVGLMQIPSARFAPDGDVAFSTGRVWPYRRNALSIQPLPGVEAVLRYTTVLNRLYGAADFSGDQRLVDKGFDVKFLLHQESPGMPQVAIGFRDFAGTGLFSSEYLVMSRRYFDLDFTLGLGWGNLGTRGQLPNPFRFLSSSFASRTNSVGQGGTLSPQYFHGERTSIFGGVSYRTPIPNLVAKVELDGNNYQSEAHDNRLPARSPFNFGLVYSHDNWLDVSLGYERGNTVMFQVALRGNLNSSEGLPKLDPPPPELPPRRPAPAAAGEQADERLLARLAAELGPSRYRVDGVAVDQHRATIAASQSAFRAVPRAIGRAARVAAAEVPPSVEELTFINLEEGLETSRVTLLRKDLEKAVAYEGSPEEIAARARIEAPLSGRSVDLYRNPERYPAYSWSWSPAMRHQIGGPDSPYLYQIFLRADAELQIARGWSLSGGLAFDVQNNFDQLKLASDSKLPHVRSDIKDYLKEGKNGLGRLQMDYLTNLGADVYGHLAGGILEEMFGGVGAEVLYKPFGERWAVGAEVYRVRQRGYDQRLDFRDYSVTTGHLDVYYRLPYHDLLAQLSVGRYLAGDSGATISLARRFGNGTTFGVFATKTNVSAEQFGEGSFDKGFYVSIPLDVLSLYSSRGSMSLGWRPLTRDGGQRLNPGKRLYPLVSESGQEALTRDWSRLLD